MRALGAGKVLFVLVGILGLTIQTIWSALKRDYAPPPLPMSTVGVNPGYPRLS
jgi:hypothetical protein